MNRRIFLKCLAMAYPMAHSSKLLANIVYDNINTTVKKLVIKLSSPGRFGFYVDYSERSTLGEHIFYVCRTHGTEGVVSVDYSTYGDTHSNASGTLTWQDGEADIKSFKVDVSTKLDGEHRVVAQLSNPTNGGVLHNGNYTRAYGVIDDDTIALNSDAVFFDADAGVNGDGSQSKPFDNIYDAIKNVGSKRYIYGKGTVVPDGSNSVNPNGGGGFVDCIILPTGRSGENTRMYIRNWPGNTLMISGGAATNKIGFYSDGGTNYNVSNFITFRGLGFSRLNASGSKYAEGGGIGYFKNGGKGINIEHCVFDDIDGSTNTSAFNAYKVDGAKIWRSTSNNIKVNGSNTNTNAGGLCLYYGASNLSFQRCETANAGAGFYFKGMDSGTVLPVVRFCKIKTRVGIDYGYGSSNGHANYGVVQGNLFKGCTTYYALYQRGASSSAEGKFYISNNVFDNCGGGDNGAIYMSHAYGHQIFNNIFYACRKMWDNPVALGSQSDSSRDVVEYADYNHDYGTTSFRYEYLSIHYKTSTDLNSVSGFAGKDTTGSPLFTDVVNGDYTLQPGSPCIGNGVYGTNQGIYLTGIEKLGAGASKRPNAPTGVTVN